MQACEMDENRHIHCETEVKNSSPQITIAFVRYVSESQTLERTGMELAVSYLYTNPHRPFRCDRLKLKVKPSPRPPFI